MPRLQRDRILLQLADLCQPQLLLNPDRLRNHTPLPHEFSIKLFGLVMCRKIATQCKQKEEYAHKYVTPLNYADGALRPVKFCFQKLRKLKQSAAVKNSASYRERNKLISFTSGKYTYENQHVFTIQVVQKSLE